MPDLNSKLHQLLEDLPELQLECLLRNIYRSQLGWEETGLQKLQYNN